jgi:uncharacterized protein
MSIAVADNPERSRYEVRLDGELAGYSFYSRRGGVVTFIHTEVDPAFEGRGLGSALMQQALDDVRRRGLSVEPYCPFVRNYIAEHPSYLDLVPEAARDRFGLASDAAGT